ncbi:hypothetical protein KC343_g13768, partial [Hortaea werneckii]
AAVGGGGVPAPNHEEEGGKSDAQLRQEALESEGALEGAAQARLSGTTARESEEGVSRPPHEGVSPQDEDDDAAERRHTTE